MSEIVTLQQFIEAIEHAKSDGIERLEDRVGPARTLFLQDPLTAWALHFLTANRMNRALRTIREDQTPILDFVRAGALVRPLTAILKDMWEDQKKQEKLEKTESLFQKATRQMNAANEKFKAIAGSELDNPDHATLKAIIGPETVLFPAMGEVLYGELLRDFLSINAKPGLQLKLVPVIVATLEAVDTKTRDYQRWETSRDVVAKGTPRFGGMLGGICGNKVDKVKLAELNNKLDELRRSTPLIAFCEVFRTAACAALKTHEIPISLNATNHDLQEAWLAVARKYQPLAALTAGHLTHVKAVQNSGSAAAPFAAAAAPNTDEPGITMPTGPLLTPGDISAWQQRHGANPTGP